MPSSFNDVLSEYNNFRATNPSDTTSLPDFAKQMDQVQGTQTRTAAYTDGPFQRIDAAVDRGFDATHLPQIAGGALGAVGTGFDKLVGTNIAPTLKSVGEGLPRTLVEGALTVPMALAGPEGDVADAAMWANRARRIGQGLGYGDAAVKGYTDTGGSIPGALIGAGSLALGQKLLPAAGSGAADAVDSYLKSAVPAVDLSTADSLTSQIPEIATRGLLSRAAPSLARFGAEAATGTGIQEATRQANLSVGPNAVGLTDPSRNPLTPENVAGDIAGAGMFLPGAIHDFVTADRPILQPKSVNNVADWINRRALAQENADSGDNEYPTPSQVSPLAAHIMGGPEDAWSPETFKGPDGKPLIDQIKTDGLDPSQLAIAHEAIQTHVAAAAQADVEGRPEDAQGYRESAARLFGLVSGSDLPPDFVQTMTSKMDTVARESPPQDPVGFVKFVKDANTLIDQMNDSDNQSPNPLVVQRLQDRGLIPKITPEWLKTEYNATFDQSGDPQFAYQVVLQKVVNHLIQATPDALTVEKTLPAAQAKTEFSPRVQAVNAQQHEFIKALGQLPPAVQKEAIARTVEINSKPTVFDQGRMKSQTSSWEQSVIQAAKSYDPNTDTILQKAGSTLDESGRKVPKFERVHVATLTARDENGNYVFNPTQSPVRIGEGGKGSTKVGGKTMAETNLEDLPLRQTADEAQDEESFKQQLASEGTQKGKGVVLGAGELPTKVGVKSGIENVPETEAPEPTKQETGLGEKLTKQADAAKKTIDGLTDQQLRMVAKPAFDIGRTDPQDVVRTPLLRYALKAALENFGATKEQGIGPAGQEFLDRVKATGKNLGDFAPNKQLMLQLRDFFKVKTPVEGGAEGVSPHLQRIGQIMQRLGDKSVVDAAKSIVRAREGDEAAPVFRNPVLDMFEKSLTSTDKKGARFQVDSEGNIGGNGLLKAVGQWAPGDLMDWYKSQGIESLLQGKKVSKEKFTEWLKKNTPEVEVKKLVPKIFDAEAVSSRIGAAQHALESAGYKVEPEMNGDGFVIHDQKGEFVDSLEDLPENLRSHAEALEQAHQEQSGALHGVSSESDAATGKYGVEPKSLEDMPGAVDMLVRVPQKLVPPEEANKGGFIPGAVKDGKVAEAPLFRGPHFGKSDVNVLASVRGYIENHPTLGKIFHVFEVQSDWGQRNRGEEQLVKDNPGLKRSTVDHPLLPSYESLGLKAAIQHARELGITKLAISDAETAMMTEGHDRYVLPEVHPETGNIQGEGRPTQERGMRAAYDERLPNIMRKLTSDKGQMVDFGMNKNAEAPEHTEDERSNGPDGSPIFKNPDGTPKTNVTARVFDISNPRPEAAQLLPRIGDSADSHVETATEDGQRQSGLRVNDPVPGAFTSDASATIRTVFRTILGKAGYSGTIKDLYTEMAVAIAKTMHGVPVDFYRLASDKVLGLATVEGGRGKVGINLDNPSIDERGSLKYANRILDTLTHEISHIDDFVRMGMIDAPDAYSQQRLVMLNHLSSLAQQLSPTERNAILSTLYDGLIPKEFQIGAREPSGRIYGSDTPVEFTATVNEMIAKSLLAGSPSRMRSSLDVLDYSPEEVRQFGQGTYRTINDVMGALKQTLEHPEVRAMLGKTDLGVKGPLLAETMHAIVASAKEASQLRFADQQVAAARNYVNTLSPGAASSPPMMTPSMWFHAAEAINDHMGDGSPVDGQALARAGEGITAAHDFIGRKSYDDSMRPGVWARWFYPFAQLMFNMERQGVPLARPVANLSLDLEGAVTRMRSSMLSGFIKQKPDGSIAFDPDNLLIKKIAKEPTGPWRRAFNQVSAWQQENGAISMFQQDEKGNITPTKEGTAKWESLQKTLKSEDQQVVMNASVALDKTSQLAAQKLSSSILESMTSRAATLGMMINPKMFHDDAWQQAGQIVTSYLKGPDAVSSLKGTIPPDVAAQYDALLGGPEGLVSKYKQVTDMLQSRPGFRTETLPGDWIVRFQRPDGQVKFLSSDSFGRATHLANKLKGEGMTIQGEIVKKSDLRDYTDFDDPDTLLRKFSQVENDSWDKFATSMGTQYGPIMEQKLREAYVPGAQSLKELGTKSMNQYLLERGSMVDRDRYDYIDGTMSWVGRLAASIAYKSTNQQKGLILNDPRASAFPSFGKMVNEHFENLMAPTAQWTKEVKAFSTAYMVGGSLSSAVINATQSITSLVPIMMQLDKSGAGVVGTYGKMFKAIGDATKVTLSKDWESLAAQAVRKDPQSWSLAEAQAALYKRNVEDGGIAHHGIIADSLFSGSDQNSVMIQKFGHGDYGPTTAPQLARNKLYLLSQLAMKPFSSVESFNNKISLMAGVEQGYSQGLRGDALYDHAKLIKVLATYAGGKANAPGLVPKLSNEYTRSAVSIANSLQMYGYGMVATYGQLAKEALGQAKGLSPSEVRQSQKAFGTMLMTQAALGGALGMPFVAAALTSLEKVFGLQANAAVRQGLAKLGGDDQELGSMISETALNGLANQMFGLDLSSRLGVDSILGTSSYRGFNMEDMLGPAPSIINNVIEGANLFGQGKPREAVKALVPNAFKKVVDMSNMQAKYGDQGMRDSHGNLQMSPTPTQAAMYVAGFRPNLGSMKEDARTQMSFANERATLEHDRVIDAASQSLLRGDPGPAQQFAMNTRAVDPTVNTRDIYSSVINRALDATNPEDLLSSGPQYDEKTRSAIARSYQAGVVQRQSELSRLQTKAALAARLGRPDLLPTNDDIDRAGTIDQLVGSSARPGMPKSQAERIADFLHSSHDQSLR